MPRANRQFFPGRVWPITHRCLKQEFLLKFERDRQRWRHGLIQAKRSYRLTLLNYIVSNHIHLLVVDDGVALCGGSNRQKTRVTVMQ